MTEKRSHIDNELLDEITKNNGTARNRNGQLKGLQQYETPAEFARECQAILIKHNGFQCSSAYDPQCGSGRLLSAVSSACVKLGVDLDPDAKNFQIHKATGASAKFESAMQDAVCPHLGIKHWHVDIAVANPPFGLRWDGLDSSKWTLDHCMEHANAGYMISNADTIKAKEWDKHPWVVDYIEREDLWDGVDVTAGVIFWRRPGNQRIPATDRMLLSRAWNQAEHILAEESSTSHKWNFWLDHFGRIKTYLSTRVKMKRNLSGGEIKDLLALEGNTPMSISGDFKARKTLKALVDCGFYQIEPSCEAAILKAVQEAHDSEVPLMPVTDFELVAYAESDGSLLCNYPSDDFTAGRRYAVDSKVYKFKEEFSRKKIHLNERSLETYTADHDCTLTGQERKLVVLDDYKRTHEFVDRPDPETEKLNRQRPESDLWQIFEKPVVNTVAEAFPDALQANTDILTGLEALGDFTYMPGQKPYIARVGTKNEALVAAETGVGKTLIAISLVQLKGARRALICAPQGTTRDSIDKDTGERSTAQWIAEIERFAPWADVYTFNNPEELEAHRLPSGELPHGFYISYYEAMFRNKARESAPKTWKNKNLYPFMGKKYQPDMRPFKDPITEAISIKDVAGGDDKDWVEGMGDCGRNHKQDNSRGIKCVAKPCLAELVGHEFDMLMLDEGHKCCNLEAQVTDALIRMQPKYRYVLTATPIPNIVSNLFSLMGWLCVPDWYKGSVCNAAWPYRREDFHRFEENFLSIERDHTAEEMAASSGGKRKKITKTSPIISSPARLLKILKPTLAYISKPDCNPDYVRPEIVDVRVSMGKQQGKLYAHYMERANVPHHNPLVKASLQLTILRGLCAEPQRSEYNCIKDSPVRSSYNPKVNAILSLCRDLFDEGRQVVIVNSRIDATDCLQARLAEAGVECSRIDSNMSPQQYAAQAAAFKRGDTRVMLMGIKCAQAYSFDKCDRLIIGSLEYSYGSFEQAKGRVDRILSKGVRIYCVLVKDSIEETVFDAVATKQDSATICLKGKRVPRDFKPIDEGELLAESFGKLTAAKRRELIDEAELIKKWPALRSEIAEAYKGIGTTSKIA